jgi:alpha-galactosidase
MGARAARWTLLALAFSWDAARLRSQDGPASTVTVTSAAEGPLLIKTSAAEFDVLPSGYVRAFLLKDGRRLTLDALDDSKGARDPSLGRDRPEPVSDPGPPKVADIRGPLGRGKRVELLSRGADGLEETVGVEVTEDFPTLAVRTLTIRNASAVALRLGPILTERHRLEASLASTGESTHPLWSFHGASAEWGRDETLPLAKGFFRENRMGAPMANGTGGGIPVVAAWSASMGEAIGHLETTPRLLSLPVRAEKDGRVSASLVLEPPAVLQPGASYVAPRSFVAVFAGDFYQPLRLYSLALQRQGWTLPRPSEESFAASWCGWGYEANFTVDQMLGVIPKLKELGIRRATLDYRWFGSYGDWEPRSDNLPGDSIRRMVDEYHRQGIRVQLWWLPLAAQVGASPVPSAASGGGVAREHPDWLILDAKGRPARMVFSVAPKEPLALLCPAVPEVQEHFKRIARKFIGEWGFDGHKLDYSYTVPPCHNPRHHHVSPEDSIRAMGAVYKAIFETTRALKPDAVTQICPCGTSPNLAWLSFMDQAVTADPVGSVQVRRRIKMYKALLGPEAAVYGDHVELSEIRQQGGKEVDSGTDFASTIGVGGVPGTKFVLAGADPEFRSLFLTPERESHWKKWLGLYNARLLSEGTFLNLYTYGFDAPEGYAIRKDGAMYYAFYLNPGASPWQGEVELRGLEPQSYRVTDYANGKDLGSIDGRAPRLKVEFARELLLEVRPE